MFVLFAFLKWRKKIDPAPHVSDVACKSEAAGGWGVYGETWGTRDLESGVRVRGLRVNAQLFDDCKISRFQHFNIPTLQHFHDFNISTCLTFQHFNISFSCIISNISTFQHSSISPTPQDINISTLLARPTPTDRLARLSRSIRSLVPHDRKVREATTPTDIMFFCLSRIIPRPL